MAEVDADVNAVIAHLPGVRVFISRIAEERASIARSLLAPHSKSGRTQVTVQHDRLDSLVSLENPRGLAAVMSIEFGRHDGGENDSDGLHILGRTFGL